MVKQPGDSAASLRSGQSIRSQRIGGPGTLSLAGTQTQLGIPDETDDGDVASQALLAALASACGLPGIEQLFPKDDPDALRGNGIMLLSQTVTALQRRDLEHVVNASISLHISAWQELQEQWREMSGMLASALQVPVDSIGLSISDVPDGMDSGCVYAFAVLLCRRRAGGQNSESGRSTGREEEQVLTYKPPSPAAPVEEDILEDPTLPERARDFEKAVRSGLPPLPRAATPEPGSTLYIYSDGASRGNPGKAATGYVVMDGAGLLVHEGGSRLEDCTNNQAEYRAIIEALEWVERELGHDFHLECRLDSELVVKQLKGEYKVKKEELKPLSMKAMNLLMYFNGFELKHVPRAENKRADALANEVLDNG